MNFAVIGHPIAHSLSPYLHETNFSLNNDSYNYEAIDIHPDDLGNIKALIVEKKLSGFNITVPHKESIIKYLDYIDDSAKNIGAVNTVKVSNGKLYGYNTDVSGYKDAFTDSFSSSKKNVLILGAGGAAKAVLEAHRQMGHEVTIVARNDKSFSSFNRSDFKKHRITEPYLETFDCIVNATPVGLKDEDAFEIFNLKDAKNKDTIGMDLIYNPSTTKFMDHFDIKKNGLDMLIYQAMDAYEIWTDKKGNREEVKDHFLKKE